MTTPGDDRPRATARRAPPANADGSRRAACGFTLAEVLIAAILGALLLVGTATGAGLFGRQVQVLKEEVDDSKERALSAISQDLRYGWSAETPSNRLLKIYDSSGRLTTYQVTNGEILVTRPNGSTGVLIDDLRTAGFTSESATRYREGAPLSRGSTVWSSVTPTGAVAQTTVLGPGDRLALGFTAGSKAPVGQSLVNGIEEQLLEATLETLSLDVGSIVATNGTLYVDLYRARSPGDARPVGSSIGQVSFNTKGFRKVNAYVWDSKKKKMMPMPKGESWGWWDLNGDYQLFVDAPTESANLNIAPFNAKIRPGFAYTLVLQVAGEVGLAFRTYNLMVADGSGVARVVSGGSWSEAPLALTSSLAGISTVTQATETQVVQRVRISLVGQDEKTVSGYASLSSQSMIDESWLGSVPGEVAP